MNGEGGGIYMCPHLCAHPKAQPINHYWAPQESQGNVEMAETAEIDYQTFKTGSEILCK